MSENKDLVLVNMAIKFGYEQSKHTAEFMKKMETYLGVIFDSGKTIRERVLTLEKLGLADNKIDGDPIVEMFFRDLAHEMNLQLTLEKHGLWQSIAQSEARCDYFIIEIARRISPDNLDIGHSTRLDDVKTKRSETKNIL